MLLPSSNWYMLLLVEPTSENCMGTCSAKQKAKFFHHYASEKACKSHARLRKVITQAGAKKSKKCLKFKPVKLIFFVSYLLQLLESYFLY